MDLHTPDSKFVRHVKYIPVAKGFNTQRQGWIMVTVTNGDIFAYVVPSWMAGVIKALYRRGGSVGRFYNRKIRNKYPSIKVPDNYKGQVLNQP